MCLLCVRVYVRDLGLMVGRAWVKLWGTQLGWANGELPLAAPSAPRGSRR